MSFPLSRFQAHDRGTHGLGPSTSSRRLKSRTARRGGPIAPSGSTASCLTVRPKEQDDKSAACRCCRTQEKCNRPPREVYPSKKVTTRLFLGRGLDDKPQRDMRTSSGASSVGAVQGELPEYGSE